MVCYIHRKILYVLPLVIAGIFADLNTNYDICKTPANETGKCVLISDCPTLLNLLQQQQPVLPETVEYLKRASCGFQGIRPKVCCLLESFNKTVSSSTLQPLISPTQESLVTASPTAEESSSPTIIAPKADTIYESRLLPNTDECGFFIQDRIDIGDDTQLDAYPWMTLLQYQKPHNITGFHCGGVLINNRYVLTAAHCVSGPNIPKNWNLMKVRLGEHDTNADEDCEASLFASFNCCCADPTVDVSIDEKIVHEKYQPNDPNQYNDIALLRLSRSVLFTEFVRPVCLQPVKQLVDAAAPGSFAEIGGWGVTEIRSEGNKKHSIRMQMKNNSECQTAFKNSVVINDKQLCANILKEKNVCYGDSGGVLMNGVSSYLSPLNYFAVGIMSYGNPICSLPEYPVVYTNVKEYIPWIINKLKP